MRRQVAVLLRRLQVLTRCALAKLCLLHAQIAQLTSGLYAQLRLLRAQLANALTGLHLTPLLLLKRLHGLRLCLAVALGQEVGNSGSLLVHQVALHLRALNALTL